MKKVASLHQYWFKLAFSTDLAESSPSARMSAAQLSPIPSTSLSYEAISEVTEGILSRVY